MTTLGQTLEDLKHDFTTLLVTKEDRFWVAKMGLADDKNAAQDQLGEAEIALNGYLQDPERLTRLKALAGTGTPDEERVLAGWLAVFGANTIDSAEGRKLSAELVALEQELQKKRGAMPLGFTDPDSGAHVAASSNKLALMLRNDGDPRRRKAAYEGLRSIEPYVLNAGFLEIVKLRNRLGRMLGFEDYYDWRVSVVERMPKKRIFAVLHDLATRTKARTQAELATFAKKHGAGALEPWNFLYLRSGELMRELDPYFPFAKSFERWGRSFHALGVRYRNATLTLDLIDRPGKYENGFMHGPSPAYFDRGTWRPARINFTANAVPGQVGSGLKATETFFHEGGHAAHFANVLQDAPCFSHEFAPTSIAYAETQSMFMDALLEDADWRARYAKNARGEPMPMSLIEAAIREQQPFKGWEVRSLMTVPFAERALYELSDAELTPDRVLEIFRTTERDLQGLTAGVRPVLAVPHLLAGESSAYYHAYVMAEMAVAQTRAAFLKRDGHLVDNPKVGEDMARHYWACGNSKTFDETLLALTGATLAADALVEECNATTDEKLAQARAAVARLALLPGRHDAVNLEATIRVMHGHEQVATTEGTTFAAACEAFERWIQSKAT